MNKNGIIITVVVIIIVILLLVFIFHHSYTESSIYYSGFWNFGMLTTPSSPSCSPSSNPQCAPTANMALYYPYRNTILGVGLPDSTYNSGGTTGSQTNLKPFTTSLTTSPAYLISPLTSQYDKNLTGAHWKIIPRNTMKPWDGGELYNIDVKCYAVPIIGTYPVTGWNSDTAMPPAGLLIQCLATYQVDNSKGIYAFNWMWKSSDSYVSAPSLQCQIKFPVNGVSTNITYYMNYAAATHLPLGGLAGLSYIQNLYMQDFNYYSGPSYLQFPVNSTSYGWFWNKNSICNVYKETQTYTGGGTCSENTDCGVNGTCNNGKCSLCSGGLLGPNCQWPTPAPITKS